MGGRLLPNARGAHWFLKAPASKKPADISHPAEREPRAWNPIDSAHPVPAKSSFSSKALCSAKPSTPGSAQIPTQRMNLSAG
jgi:hypothetical protein